MTVVQVIRFILKELYQYSSPTHFVSDINDVDKDQFLNKVLLRLPAKGDVIARDIVAKENRFFARLGTNPITRMLMKKSASFGVLPKSADMLHIGNGDMEVKGILVTFTASIKVIQYAVEQGCNFIITHEPTFYTHHDNDARIKETTQYKEKRKLLEDHNIALWRFHDLCHLLEKDFILEGVLKKAGYMEFMTTKMMNLMVLERKTTVDTIIGEMKERLGATAMRLIGDCSMPVERYALLSGMPDNVSAIQYMEQKELDLIIIGEINEWELGDFVRDSIELGKKRALLVMGHQPSELAGMEYFREWLGQRMPNEKILFEASESYFKNV